MEGRCAPLRAAGGAARADSAHSAKDSRKTLLRSHMNRFRGGIIGTSPVVACLRRGGMISGAGWSVKRVALFVVRSSCRPRLGFKSYRTDAVTLAGVELVHRIRQRQFKLERAGGPSGR